MKKSLSRKKNNHGQALLEFMFVSMVLITLVFTAVQLAWGMAFGHYVHYATYMAARAYMSAGAQKQDQVENAKNTLVALLKRDGGQQDLLPFLAKARTGDSRDIGGGTEDVAGAFIGTHPHAENKQDSRYYSFAEGVQYNFSVPLFLFSLGGLIERDLGKNIDIGRGEDAVKPMQWRGGIPFTSDAWLGREPSTAECFQEMERISHVGVLNRSDGALFIEDNGC